MEDNFPTKNSKFIVNSTGFPTNPQIRGGKIVLQKKQQTIVKHMVFNKKQQIHSAKFGFPRRPANSLYENMAFPKKQQIHCERYGSPPKTANSL